MNIKRIWQRLMQLNDHNRDTASVIQKIYSCVEKHLRSIPLQAAENNRLRLSTQTLTETQRKPQTASLSLYVFVCVCVCGTVALSPAGFLCYIWLNVIFTPQYELSCVDINTHSRPIKSIRARTDTTFNRREKLLFPSANTSQTNSQRP